MKSELSINQKIGKAVRSRRMELGYSQEELADICGLHRTYIGGIERGERNITISSLEGIATGLNCKITDLLEGK